LREKLIAPGRLSKNVPPAGATVNVTGMVIETVPDCEVTTICPLYVPAASAGLAVTIAVTACGVA
jgi:hypothetical protein